MRSRISHFTRSPGFTLIELLVSMSILTLLLLMLVAITGATQRTWSYTTGKVEQFRDAREAFESLSRKLRQATLNTYLDYDDPTAPTTYMRQSELRFISGDATTLTGATNMPTHAIFFQAPLGYVDDTTNYGNLETLLNTWGYFIEFGSNRSWRPPFINSLPHPLAERYRFRLMELMEPSESLTLYQSEVAAGGNAQYDYHHTEWFTTPLSAANRPARVLAENIIALVLLPKLTPQEDPTGALLCPSYAYNSAKTDNNNSTTVNAAINWKNQLPPVVQVTMVAVDDASFGRFLRATTMMPSSLFTDSGGQALFQNAGDIVNSDNAGYAQDMKTLQKNLQAQKINYRVFTTDVSIKAAKWSRIQTH